MNISCKSLKSSRNIKFNNKTDVFLYSKTVDDKRKITIKHIGLDNSPYIGQNGQ